MAGLEDWVVIKDTPSNANRSRTALAQKVGASIPAQISEPLTFGIEFEFILIVDTDNIPWGIPHSLETGIDIVRKVLQKDGKVKVFGENDIETRDLDVWVETYDSTGGDVSEPKIGSFNADRFRKWTVEDDASITLNDDGYTQLPHSYGAFSVELKSRIFSVHQDNWMEEITHVLNLLHSKLNSGKDGSSIRLVTNNTCGLHVHVGRQATANSPGRFTVETLKKLLQLTTGFERQIDQLHTTNRIKHENTYFPPYCQPPSLLFLQPAHNNPLLQKTRTGTPKDWCKAIETHIHRLQDLPLITANKKYLAYNLANATPSARAWTPTYEKARKWTVEFRQHRGTLDPDELFAWLGFVLPLVNHAATTPARHIWDLLFARVDDPAFATSDLLAAIGAPAAVAEHYASAPALAELEYRDRADVDSRGSDALATPRKAYYAMVRGEVGAEESVRALLRNNLKVGLAASAFRRWAVVKKLERGEYGNFDARLKVKLLAVEGQ